MLCRPVISIHYIFQTFDLFKPMLNITGHIASDDLFLQCFDLQLMLGRKRIITGIRKAQPLEQGIHDAAAGHLLSIFDSGQAHRITNAITQALLCQLQFFPPLLDNRTDKNVLHRETRFPIQIRHLTLFSTYAGCYGAPSDSVL